jgi:hypothetical protein
VKERKEKIKKEMTEIRNKTKRGKEEYRNKHQDNDKKENKEGGRKKKGGGGEKGKTFPFNYDKPNA